MPELDVQLFGKILTACGYLTPDEYEGFLSQVPEGKEDEVGSVLVSAGRLSEKQVKAARVILNQERGPSRSGQADFDNLVDLKRHARAGDLHKVQPLLERLKDNETYAYLGELLAVKSEMNAAQMARALADHKQTLLFCEGCCTRVLVNEHEAGKQYACDSCGEPMHAPQSIDVIEGISA